MISHVRAERLIAAIRPFVDASVVPGAIVGLRDGGETTVDFVGTTTPAGGDPLLVDAQVRISSNTKPMVAALTVLLAQDGVLGLDDPVELFVPELAGLGVKRPVAVFVDGSQLAAPEEFVDPGSTRSEREPMRAPAEREQRVGVVLPAGTRPEDAEAYPSRRGQSA